MTFWFSVWEFFCLSDIFLYFGSVSVSHCLGLCVFKGSLRGELDSTLCMECKQHCSFFMSESIILHSNLVRTPYQVKKCDLQIQSDHGRLLWNPSESSCSSENWQWQQIVKPFSAPPSLIHLFSVFSSKCLCQTL